MLDSRLRVVQETCSVFTARSMVARKTPDGRGFEKSELLYKSIYCWTDKTI
jgi:hypothetical protein